MQYILTRYNEKIMTTSNDFDIANYIHKNHSYSMYHATTYEGYKVTAIDNETKEITILKY